MGNKRLKRMAALLIAVILTLTAVPANLLAGGARGCCTSDTHAHLPSSNTRGINFECEHFSEDMRVPQSHMVSIATYDLLTGNDISNYAHVTAFDMALPPLGRDGLTSWRQRRWWWEILHDSTICCCDGGGIDENCTDITLPLLYGRSMSFTATIETDLQGEVLHGGDVIIFPMPHIPEGQSGFIRSLNTTWQPIIVSEYAFDLSCECYLYHWGHDYPQWCDNCGETHLGEFCWTCEEYHIGDGWCCCAEWIETCEDTGEGHFEKHCECPRFLRDPQDNDEIMGMWRIRNGHVEVEFNDSAEGIAYIQFSIASHEAALRTSVSAGGHRDITFGGMTFPVYFMERWRDDISWWRLEDVTGNHTVLPALFRGPWGATEGVTPTHVDWRFDVNREALLELAYETFIPYYRDAGLDWECDHSDCRYHGRGFNWDCCNNTGFFNPFPMFTPLATRSNYLVEIGLNGEFESVEFHTRIARPRGFAPFNHTTADGVEQRMFTYFLPSGRTQPVDFTGYMTEIVQLPEDDYETFVTRVQEQPYQWGLWTSTNTCFCRGQCGNWWWTNGCDSECGLGCVRCTCTCGADCACENLWTEHSSANFSTVLIAYFGTLGKDGPRIIDVRPDFIDWVTNSAMVSDGWDESLRPLVRAWLERMYGPDNLVGGHILYPSIRVVESYEPSITPQRIMTTMNNSYDIRVKNCWLAWRWIICDICAQTYDDWCGECYEGRRRAFVCWYEANYGFCECSFSEWDNSYIGREISTYLTPSQAWGGSEDGTRVELRLYDQETYERLTGVPFQLQILRNGEWQVMRRYYTNDSGYFDTRVGIGDFRLVQVGVSDPVIYRLNNPAHNSFNAALQAPYSGNFANVVVQEEVKVLTVYNVQNATVDITVIKEWTGDEGYEDHIAPIQVQLLANGAPYVFPASASQTNPVTLNALGWTAVFTNMPLYDAANDPIVWTVEELDIPDEFEATVTVETSEDGHMEFTVTNTFTAPIGTPMYTVTFVAGAGGSISAIPANEITVPRGTVLTTAHVPIPTANSGYEFTGWTTTNPIGHEVVANITFTANFAPIDRPMLTVTFVAGAGGSISATPANAISVPQGTVLAAAHIPTPIANAGYQFVNWTASNPLGHNVTADITFTANFAPVNGGTPGLPPQPLVPPVIPGPPSTPGTLLPPPTQPYTPWQPRDPIYVPFAPPVAEQQYQIEYDDPTPAALLTPVAPMPVSPIHHAYMIGFAEDGTIRPQANITRAEVTTIFFRLITDQHRANIWSQANGFDDVELQRWFNNPISTMENGGLFAGIPLGTSFAPNQTATRAEFAAMVVNYLGLGHYRVTDGYAFTDIAGHWAADAINVAFMQGWVTGYSDGTFRPDALITRAEVAALINRALGRLPEMADDLLPDMVTWPDNMNVNAWYYLYIQEATNSHNHEMKTDGVHETWTEIIAPRNWRALERLDSSPWDINN